MLSFPEIYLDIVRIIVLRKRGYIVDNQITQMHPLTMVKHQVDIYTDEGMKLVNSMFRISS